MSYLFATEEYLEATICLFHYEKSVLGYTKVMAQTNYNNMVYQLLSSGLPKETQIRVLASYDLASTFVNVNFPDAAFQESKQALMLLMAGDKLPKRCDGMIAKAIQSLRYHQEFSYDQFVEV